MCKIRSMPQGLKAAGVDASGLPGLKPRPTSPGLRFCLLGLNLWKGVVPGGGAHLRSGLVDLHLELVKCYLAPSRRRFERQDVVMPRVNQAVVDHAGDVVLPGHDLTPGLGCQRLQHQVVVIRISRREWPLEIVLVIAVTAAGDTFGSVRVHAVER